MGFLLFGGGPADPSEEIEEIIERKLKEEQLAAEAAEAEASGPIMKESQKLRNISQPIMSLQELSLLTLEHLENSYRLAWCVHSV